MSKTQTWRRHKCTSCKATFTTKERIDWSGYTTVKSAGKLTPYSRERLLLSIIKASNNLTLPLGAITDLTDTIELELQANAFFTEKLQDVEVITQTAMGVLNRYDTNLALQYINKVYQNRPPLELLQSLVTPRYRS